MTRSGKRQVFTAFLALFLGCKQTDGSNVQPPATPSPATAGNPVAPATTPNGAAGTLPGASPSTAGTPTGQSSVASSPVGTWMKCDADGLNIWYGFKEVVTQTSWTSSDGIYSDAKCTILSPNQGGSSRISNSLQYVVGKASSAVPGAYELQLIFQGQTLYTIFKIEGNKLYKGDTDTAGNGSSVSSRPTQLSPKFSTKVN